MAEMVWGVGVVEGDRSAVSRDQVSGGPEPLRLQDAGNLPGLVVALHASWGPTVSLLFLLLFPSPISRDSDPHEKAWRC